MPTEYKNIWLVDDDPSILRLLSTFLKRKGGFNVRCFENGDEALEAIQEGAPDVLITDWEMPKMNGLELCRRVREIDLPNYIYIIFLTAKSGSSKAIEGLNVGADDFVTKPVNQEELLARVWSGGRVIDLERRLQIMARTDALTGIFNRRVFFEELESEWERSNRTGSPLSCVIIDLDFFKQINDTYGHAAGDLVLRTVGSLLKKSCRTNDVPSRYGGEEFSILMPETTEEEAHRFAERIRRRLEKTPIDIGGEKPLYLSASFGVAQRHAEIISPDELVDWADQALGLAKQAGRNRVVVGHAPEEGEALPELSALEKVFSHVKAERVMTPIVATLPLTRTIDEAADFFLNHRIHSAPVVDQERRLVGILNENDIIGALSMPEWKKSPIRDIMQTNLVCYKVDTPIRKIYEFLMRVALRFVIIVDQEKPVGIISRYTLLRWLRNRFSTPGQTLPTKEKTGPATIGRIQETTEAIRKITTRLNRFLHHMPVDEEQLVPQLVDSATVIQDLSNQLLTLSDQSSTEDAVTIHELLDHPKKID